MAGMAALRAGAGLSTVATPARVLGSVNSFAAELMTEPLHETHTGSIAVAAAESDRFIELSKSMTVVAIGPGIGRHPETVQFVHEAVHQTKVPLVLDADGLNAFQDHTHLLDGRRRPLVLTPHPGEMSRLAGITIKAVQADRINVARSFARDHHLVLVLKGDRTVVALPDGSAWINPTGNPGMATGGTGDILTGMTAGIIGADAERLRPCNDCRRLPARSGRRRCRRANGRALTDGDRSVTRTAGSVPARGAICVGRHRADPVNIATVHYGRDKPAAPARMFRLPR